MKRLFPLTVPILLAAGCAAHTQTPPAEAPAPAAAQALPEVPFLDVAALERLCDESVEGIETQREAITSLSEPPTVENALRPFDDAWAAVDKAAGWSSLLYNAHPDEAVREAARACQERVESLANALTLDRALYDVLAQVDLDGADPLARRAAEHILRDFRRAGVDKDEATRARLAAIHEEMVRLMQTFGKNVREDVRSIQVDSVEQLQGLPQDWIEAHAPGEDGRITVTTDYPDFFPFETYAQDPALRQALYEAYLNRGHPANAEILEQVLALRHEYATLLGYSDWADYMAEDKMVRSADTIASFIDQVEAIARPRMEQDLQELLAAKREVQPEAQAVQVWDRFYWTGKVREARYGFDARQVRPYFPYTQVKEGILDLYADLFGVEFEKVDAPVWHESVDAYVLKDEGKPIARFYLDMHPRAGKYKHAAAFPLQTGTEGGREPMAALVCNFPDPSQGDGRALMEHNQVRTFFHEFGHLIHHLLGREGDWVRLAGFNVEWDFVEAPSQILEEWAWSPEVLSRFARHVETGEPIPAALVERMKAADSFGKGIDVMRQIFYAAYSFNLHRADPAGLDLEAVTDDLYERYNPYPRPEGTHVYGSFGHLMGYSSQYYTYQWSLTIAKDLASRFKDEGLLNQSVSREYRRAILERGGTVDAEDMVEDFLGRPRNLDAYRSWLQEE